jgi:serine/threonine-protein kinase
LLYQLLIGRPPFQGQSIDVIVKHVNEAPKPLRSVRSDIQIPGEVEAIVMRCLEKDPNRRFQTMDDVLDALRRAGGSTTGVTRAPKSPHAPVYGRARTPAKNQKALRDASTSAVTDIEGTRPDRPRASLFDDENSRTMPDGARRVLTWLLRGVVMGAACALVLAGFQWLRPAAPLPMAPAQPIGALRAREAETARVRFRVDTEPQGAKVTLNGREVGVTPLLLEVTRASDGMAHTELTFTMPGYNRATVTASGYGPEVAVLQKLQRP